MKYLGFFFYIIFYCGYAFCEGGATVVGDGGVAVKCEDRGFRFFDIFEEELLTGRSQQLTLGSSGKTVKEMVKTGLKRIEAEYNLSAAEMHLISNAINSFSIAPFDPWEVPALFSNYHDYLYVRSIVTLPTIATYIRNQNCQLHIAAINPHAPDIRGYAQLAYYKICRYGSAAVQDCLLQNLEVILRLKSNERACLVIHEALRFLPARVKIRGEFLLRRAAVRICTR